MWKGVYQIHQQEKTKAEDFESANAECKEVIRPLRARSTSKWIRYTADVVSCSPDMTVIREAATRHLERTQDFKCFHCGDQGHLRDDLRKKPT